MANRSFEFFDTASWHRLIHAAAPLKVGYCRAPAAQHDPPACGEAGPGLSISSSDGSDRDVRSTRTGIDHFAQIVRGNVLAIHGDTARASWYPAMLRETCRKTGRLRFLSST